MERLLDELDQLYYRNLVRGIKLKIAKRELDKKRELALSGKRN